MNGVFVSPLFFGPCGTECISHIMGSCLSIRARHGLGRARTSKLFSHKQCDGGVGTGQAVRYSMQKEQQRHNGQRGGGWNGENQAFLHCDKWDYKPDARIKRRTCHSAGTVFLVDDVVDAAHNTLCSIVLQSAGRVPPWGNL